MIVLTEEEYYAVLYALGSCETKVEHDSHRFHSTIHQSFDEVKVQRVLLMLQRKRAKR